jgi:excisionase family DNA binding protein
MFEFSESQSNVPRIALSVREAAKSLGICEKHFREKVLPNLRVFRVGRRVLVLAEQLQEYVVRNSS